MRIRYLLVTLAAALALALAAPAGASVTVAQPPALVPPSPNHTVVDVRGRHAVVIYHFGDINRGQARCSAQGEVVDGPDADAEGDGLRGRAACIELRTAADGLGHVTRFRIYGVRLQVLDAGTWQDVAVDDQDAVSTNDPADIRWYTPVPGFCPPPDNLLLTWRVVQTVGIRWTDGTAGTHTVASEQFRARAAANTLC